MEAAEAAGSMMNPLRLLAGLVLLAGAYVLVIAVVLLNVGIAVAPILLALIWPASSLALPVIVVPLAVIAGINVLAIGIAIVTASRKTAEPWASVQLPAGDAPQLTAMISDIAARGRAPVPAELRLVSQANAAVSEDPRILGLGRATRRLYLGLPILMGMSRSQLNAILSHEIGHYAGGHSRFGALVHRGAISLTAICTVLRMLQAGDPEASPGVVWKVLRAIQREYVALDYKLFSGYAWLYNRVFFFIRRTQEYEADRVAARIAGGAEVASALRRACVLSAAWSDFQNRFLRPMRGIRCVPDDPFEAFGHMLTAPGYQAALREWAASPPRQPAGPLDSHPCLADRLVRLGDAADRDGAPSGGVGREPATALLPVLPDRPWIPQLTEAMSGTAAVDSLPWDECVNRLGQARAAQSANRLLLAATAVSPVGTGGGGADPAAVTPTLGYVLGLVQTRRGELAAGIALAGSAAGARPDAGSDPASQQDPLTPLTTALLALLSCVMVATGRMRWRVTWRTAGEPLRLATDDGADAGIEQTMDRVNSFVSDPSTANADSLSLHLLSLGIDLDAPVRPSLTGLGAASSTVPHQGASGSAAPGTTVVVRPALDPRRDRLRPVVRGVGIVALLLVTVAGVVSRSHSQAPRFSPAVQPAPFYSQPADALPSFRPPILALPTPNFTFPVTLPTDLIVPIRGRTFDCTVSAGGASCMVITARRGDTLSLLACRYRTSVAVLQALNNLGTSTTIKAGERLVVPDPKNGTAACG